METLQELIIKNLDKSIWAKRFFTVDTDAKSIGYNYINAIYLDIDKGINFKEVIFIIAKYVTNTEKPQTIFTVTFLNKHLHPFKDFTPLNKDLSNFDISHFDRIFEEEDFIPISNISKNMESYEHLEKIFRNSKWNDLEFNSNTTKISHAINNLIKDGYSINFCNKNLNTICNELKGYELDSRLIKEHWMTNSAQIRFDSLMGDEDFKPLKRKANIQNWLQDKKDFAKLPDPFQLLPIKADTDKIELKENLLRWIDESKVYNFTIMPSLVELEILKEKTFSSVSTIIPHSKKLLLLL